MKQLSHDICTAKVVRIQHLHKRRKHRIFATAIMLLSTQHLDIGYGEHLVQQDLNLQVERGNMICMLGKNGCGKSTLLRTLAGLQNPLGGDVYIADNNINSLNRHQRATLLSLVLTERLSMDNTTVHDVVAMGRYPYSSFLGGLTEKDKKQIADALSAVGIAEKNDCPFNCMSDGEKQRVLIAKALAQQTPIILLDEPTAHLDLNNRIRILLLLRKLVHDTQRSVIISTHELDLALQMADIIWLMAPQNGIETGTPDALIRSGAFQNAFQDDNFNFINSNGRLRIALRQEQTT